jgi:hypothetical protein
MRKIKEIKVATAGQYAKTHIHALCEDGTVWGAIFTSYDKAKIFDWVKAPDIPDDEEQTPRTFGP